MGQTLVAKQKPKGRDNTIFCVLQISQHSKLIYKNNCFVIIGDYIVSMSRLKVKIIIKKIIKNNGGNILSFP